MAAFGDDGKCRTTTLDIYRAMYEPEEPGLVGRINKEGGAYNVRLGQGEVYRTVDWFGPHIWELPLYDLVYLRLYPITY